MLALASKTYIAFKDDQDPAEVAPDVDADYADEEAGRQRFKDVKIACKGVQQRNNATQLTIRNFRGVLYNSQPIVGTNRGFACRPDGVVTYQTKRSIQGIYLKRRVARNMRDTSALHDLDVDK